MQGDSPHMDAVAYQTLQKKYLQLKKIIDGGKGPLLEALSGVPFFVDLMHIQHDFEILLGITKDFEESKPITNDGVEVTQEWCEESLEEVVGWYKLLGVGFPKDWTICFVEGSNPYLPNIAFVLNEVEDHIDNGIKNSWITWKKILHDHFDLELPQELYEEYRNYYLMNGKSLLESIKRLNNGSDITLVSKLVEGFSETEIKGYLVHELFHLLEMEQGIHYVDPMLREGTAVYVQNVYLGRTIEHPGEYDGKKHKYEIWLAYKLVPYLTQELIKTKNPDNPIKDILNGVYVDDLNEMYYQNIQGLQQSHYLDAEGYALKFNTFIQQSFLQDENYQGFAKDPSLENLLLSIEKSGMPEYAEWLGQQDGVSSLLDKYRTLLEEVSHAL